MINSLYLWGILGIYNRFDNQGYYNELDGEEKGYMDYVNNCLFNSDEKISTACSKMMLLILKAYSSLKDNEDICDEEIQSEKNLIYSDLNDEEKEIVDSFGHACINTIGIYSEESINQRKLRNERK